MLGFTPVGYAITQGLSRCTTAVRRLFFVIVGVNNHANVSKISHLRFWAGSECCTFGQALRKITNEISLLDISMIKKKKKIWLCLNKIIIVLPWYLSIKTTEQQYFFQFHKWSTPRKINFFIFTVSSKLHCPLPTLPDTRETHQPGSRNRISRYYTRRGAAPLCNIKTY